MYHPSGGITDDYKSCTRSHMPLILVFGFVFRDVDEVEFIEWWQNEKRGNPVRRCPR